MKYKDNFAVFILSHGRPQNIKTLNLLKKTNYTGKYYIVIDNEDKTADEYKDIYKDKVLQFDKLAISKTFDTADNFDDRRTIVYARNVCFELAKKLNIEYFLELDDDYTDFRFLTDENNIYKNTTTIDFDSICDIFIDFLKKTPTTSIAFAQGGDLIGGGNGGLLQSEKIKRKAMNSFFCSINKPFKFLGRINEDVNTYTLLGSTGYLFFTSPDFALTQTTTQVNQGGMSDVYLDSGTYLKSFYSIMFMPSAVKISLMGTSNKRLHHRIKWENCVPCILREKYKKD